jgi:hypothetical protein
MRKLDEEAEKEDRADLKKLNCLGMSAWLSEDIVLMKTYVVVF